jgi:hypothetical protein
MYYTNARVTFNSLILRSKMLSVKSDMAIDWKIIVRIAKVRIALLFTRMALIKSYYIVIYNGLYSLFNCLLTCASCYTLLLCI